MEIHKVRQLRIGMGVRVHSAEDIAEEQRIMLLLRRN